MTICSVEKGGREWTRDDLAAFKRFIAAAKRYEVSGFYFSGTSYTIDYAENLADYIEWRFKNTCSPMTEEEKVRVAQADPVAVLRGLLYPDGPFGEVASSISGEDVKILVTIFDRFESIADMVVHHVVVPRHAPNGALAELPTIFACDYQHPEPSCRDAACHIRTNRMHSLNGLRENMEVWANKEGITMPHSVRTMLSKTAQIIKEEVDSGLY